jgi:hypothetical protein
MTAKQRRDLRLLDQSVRALVRVIDWLDEVDAEEIDGELRDDLGYLLHRLERAADGAR